MVRFIRVSVSDLYCSSHLLSKMQFVRLNFFKTKKTLLLPDSCFKKKKLPSATKGDWYENFRLDTDHNGAQWDFIFKRFS